MPRVLAMLPLLLVLLAGCQSTDRSYVRPTIAVLRFDNRAPFPYQWDIGGGTKDILVDRLMKTQRYQVIERPELAAIQREIQLENSGLTRPQDRAKLGQLKNVQYLIKGTITDFCHVAGAHGGARWGPFGVFGSSNVAMMSMNLYVIHVESGEVIASEHIEECVAAGSADAKGAYKGVAFGGGAFFNTPLGQATTRAIDRAVDRITHVIAAQPWAPKIAAINADRTVIVNGGSDRGVQANMAFDVLVPGTPITDPDTGDVLGKRPGTLVARIRIVEVKPAYATGVVTDGFAQNIPVGAACQRTR